MQKNSIEKEITYPTKEGILAWMELLASENPILKFDLPSVDDNWVDEILSIIDRCRLPYYPESIHGKAAHIFYKIIKNHNYVDSNKRSSIVIIYLFFLLNDFILLRKSMRYNGCHIDIKELAKRVAKSSSKRYENVIKKLENCFISSTKKAIITIN